MQNRLNKSFLLLILLIFNFPLVSSAQELKAFFIKIPFPKSKILDLRVGILEPEKSVADIIFIHGFADRLDNHIPLYKSWSQKGFRVISFDLPSHGENKGSANNLNDFNFEKLSSLIDTVETKTRINRERPLILAGWSAGGLLIVRKLQEKWNTSIQRKIAGIILLTPGISVYKFPWQFGNGMGFVTEGSLTHDTNPPHVGPVKPVSPLWSSLAMSFSPLLILNSYKSFFANLPADIPTLIYVAGDKEDTYAQSLEIKKWIIKQNSTRVESNKILAFQCPQARHEVDNETPEYGGNEVKEITALFAENIVYSDTYFNKSLAEKNLICNSL